MSWFKRGSREDGHSAINGRASPAQIGGSGRDRAGTDSDTCFEVFKNHWQQATQVIGSGVKKFCTNDDVETVVHNVEQMMNLLVGEDGLDGMPGPIVNYLLEKEVMETFCNWCNCHQDYQDRLCLDQLRMYEILISQSRQLLLIHRQVIRPLLRLLLTCSETQRPSRSGSGSISSDELEFRLVLVLHQICTCISQETVILESFFSTEADHGPAKFLIFSLLIPYIHREGPIGQRARDALLLLMTLSAVHPHIGRYIAENSDFCPVLATGLSGLYSSLPRKITPSSEDWYALTEAECQLNVDLLMFLNSLDFCNAVVQIAHPLVRDQLIKYIYSGFLVPVLGPALNQDISGLPIPLLDTNMFMNSREEVMTATAYLDLFLRRVSEPLLIKAFLKFILTERLDEISILESLITRLSSNTQLAMVSLSFFHTLVDLNCEDVMYQLVFRYLIPCTHVMVSQRRAVRDLDLYGKSAEKFLSLRPVCCMACPTPAPTHQGPSPSPSSTPVATVTGLSLPATRGAGHRSASISVPAELTKVKPEPKRRGLFQSKKDKGQLATVQENEQKPVSDSASSTSTGSAAPALNDDANAVTESSYSEYLMQARSMLKQCTRACRHWSALYDGECPPPDSVQWQPVPSSVSAPPILSNVAPRLPNASDNDRLVYDGGLNGDGAASTIKLLSQGGIISDAASNLPGGEAAMLTQNFNKKQSDGDGSVVSQNTIARSLGKREQSPVISLDSWRKTSPSHEPRLDIARLKACPDLDSFLACLSELNSVAAVETSKASSLDQVLASFDSLLDALVLKAETSDKKKSVGFMLDASISKRTDCTAEVVRNSRSSPDVSSSNSAPTAGLSKPAEPPKTLNLPTAKDGGKCRARAILRTPDDLSRASLVNPCSPGFLLSPVSPGLLLSPSSFCSTVNHPLPNTLRYPSTAPNIGPFLAAVFGRLEGMLGNSLYLNLLLTGLVTRLAAYPAPLLRSFLLNVNLVFQPSVKSLVQVLSSVRQKVDSYAVTSPNFVSLIHKARLNLKMREDSLQLPSQDNAAPLMPLQTSKLRAATIGELPAVKKKTSLADLLFRRSPKPGAGFGRDQQLQRLEVAGSVAYHFINSHFSNTSTIDKDSLNTWNAVYCAILLEEFLKELAALSQEHSVLFDEGYASS